MKKTKLLFWVDSFLLHYCLAYFIQQKSNYEISAIVDVTNKAKSFFENQKLVNFEKKWFYHDFIDFKKEPNSNYLQTFEEKYQINLWNVALNERVFYKYNSYYKFKDKEILSFLESECRLFEKILLEYKPDFLVTLDLGLHHSNLLTKMCRKIGIKVLSVTVSKFPNNCYLSESTETLMEDPDEKIDNNYSFEDLENLLNQNNLSESLGSYYSEMRKSKFSKFSAGLSILLESNNNIQTHFTYYGRTKLKLFLAECKNFFQTWYRGNFLTKRSQHYIRDEKFIYFPLHQEPERSLLIDASFYTNQIETIRHIAKSIPIDYVLYVKDHPTQGTARGWRSISNYKEILEIPNVRLIHPNVSSKDLIKKSDLVITVSGSASFESLIYQKPSILFADYGYQNAGIRKINCLENLPDEIRNMLNSTVDIKKLSSYISNLLKNSFEFDYFGFHLRSGNEFFYNNNTVDVSIQEEQMKQYLIKEEIFFKNITQSHLRFIETT
jgi:hypothetical protein